MRFAGKAAQIIELGAAYFTATHDIEPNEARACRGEYPLDADAEGDAPDRDRACGNAASDFDECAFEGLEPFGALFDHLKLDFDRVTDKSIFILSHERTIPL